MPPGRSGEDYLTRLRASLFGRYFAFRCLSMFITHSLHTPGPSAFNRKWTLLVICTPHQAGPGFHGNLAMCSFFPLLDRPTYTIPGLSGILLRVSSISTLGRPGADLHCKEPALRAH